MRTAEFVPKWCSLPCVLQVVYPGNGSSNLKQHRIENFVSRSSRECARNSQKRDCDRLLSANEGYCSSLQTTFARVHEDLFDKLAAVIFRRLQSVGSCRETHWKTLGISLCRSLRAEGDVCA